MLITLPPNYPYVMLTALWISFQCYFVGMSVPYAQRKKVFNREFMKQFDEQHIQSISKSGGAPAHGYPDMGTGIYSEKLSYKDWFNFNLAQRAHFNFLEQILIVLFLILVAGFKYPDYTVIAGLVYSFGRFLMVRGYTKKIEGRKLGVAILNVALAGLFTLSISSALSLQK